MRRVRGKERGREEGERERERELGEERGGEGGELETLWSKGREGEGLVV